MEPQDFLELAQRLQQQGNQEADFRTAASRVYYACYHLLSSEVRKLCPDTLRREMGGTQQVKHQSLVAYFSKANHPSFDAISQQLSSLKTKRETADYSLHKSYKKSDSALALEEAEFLIEELEKMQAEEIRYAVESYYARVHRKPVGTPPPSWPKT